MRRPYLRAREEIIAVVAKLVFSLRRIVQCDYSARFQPTRESFVRCSSASGRLIAVEKQEIDRRRPLAPDVGGIAGMNVDPVEKTCIRNVFVEDLSKRPSAEREPYCMVMRRRGRVARPIESVDAVQLARAGEFAGAGEQYGAPAKKRTDLHDLRTLGGLESRFNKRARLRATRPTGDFARRFQIGGQFIHRGLRLQHLAQREPTALSATTPGAGTIEL